MTTLRILFDRFRLAALVAVAMFSAAAHGSVVQQAYLKASNPGLFDEFGFATSLSGDTAVIGARDEASNATGVNGNQADNSAGNAGAAYVFVRNAGAWSQQAYLKASNTEGNDFFGQVAAISGDTIVVGAWGEDSNASGVNGNQASNAAQDSGAVYVFVRTGTTWTQQAYLKASNPEPFDHFGWSVAISGDTILVGANNEDSNATGVNGNQSDNSKSAAGAAYVFVRTGTTWTQQAYLKASNPDQNDVFGSAVAIAGDTAVVGAFGEASGTGSPSDNSANAAGAAYVFVRSGTTWSQQAYLKASNPGQTDVFAIAVAIDGDTIVAGAGNEDSNATGVNGNQSDNSAGDAGAAYVFVRSGTVWSQQAYLKASNTEMGDIFGESVVLSGNRLLIGSSREDSADFGVNGNQGSNGAVESGAAYLFTRSGSTWSQHDYIKASNTEALDNFGFAVAIDGDVMLIGADIEDGGVAGVNGNQSDNSASGAGAVYAFDLGAWHDLGFGVPGVTGVPKLTGTGTLEVGSAGSLVLTSAKPSAAAILLVSFASTPSTAFCGTLVPLPATLVSSFVTDAGGGVPLAWSSWPAGLSGLNLFCQWLIADPAAPCTVSMSNAVRGDVP